MKYIAFVLLSLLFVVVFSLVLFKQFDQPVNIIDEPINESVEVFEINFDSGQSCTSETSIKEVINLKQRCETSNDCVIAKYGCPFGCRDFMNMENHQLVAEKIKLYRATCGNQCRYRWVIPPFLIDFKNRIFSCHHTLAL